MTISMYAASVPLFVRGLTSMRSVLVKAESHAQTKKIADTVFVTARLSPDMLPLAKQVQIASDFARSTTARLAGKEPPPIEDSEATFAELIARVDKTLDYLKPFTAGEIDGSEERQVTRTIRGQPRTFTGVNYLQNFALPNFYFHCAMAYGILRHNGVELGKADFLGPLE